MKIPNFFRKPYFFSPPIANHYQNSTVTTILLELIIDILMVVVFREIIGLLEHQFVENGWLFKLFWIGEILLILVWWLLITHYIKWFQKEDIMSRLIILVNVVFFGIFALSIYLLESPHNTQTPVFLATNILSLAILFSALLLTFVPTYFFNKAVYKEGVKKIFLSLIIIIIVIIGCLALYLVGNKLAFPLAWIVNIIGFIFFFLFLFFVFIWHQYTDKTLLFFFPHNGHFYFAKEFRSRSTILMSAASGEVFISIFSNATELHANEWSHFFFIAFLSAIVLFTLLGVYIEYVMYLTYNRRHFSGIFFLSTCSCVVGMIFIATASGLVTKAFVSPTLTFNNELILFSSIGYFLFFSGIFVLIIPQDAFFINKDVVLPDYWKKRLTAIISIIVLIFIIIFIFGILIGFSNIASIIILNIILVLPIIPLVSLLTAWYNAKPGLKDADKKIVQ